MGEIALGAHDGAKLLDVLFHGATDDRVAVLTPAFHFESGISQANLHLLLGLGPTAQEPAAEFLKIRRDDENIGERTQD